jgi:hypothetical protein
MKLIISDKIPENEAFRPIEEGWKAVKEPKSVVVTMLISLPIGLLMSSIVIFIAYMNGIESDIKPNISLVIALLIIIPIHELIHALVFPEPINSDKVIFGLLPKVGAFYAHYEGEMKKIRFLITLLAPFIVITIIPLIFLCVTGIDMPFVIKISAVNALCASADVFGFFTILFQLPKNSVVRNKGIKTYWKPL